MILRLQSLHQGSHMIKFLLLSLEKGRMIAIRALTGMQLISSEEKKCLGNKHVIVMFEDMLFHEPVEASFL